MASSCGWQPFSHIHGRALEDAVVAVRWWSAVAHLLLAVGCWGSCCSVVAAAVVVEALALLVVLFDWWYGWLCYAERPQQAALRMAACDE